MITFKQFIEEAAEWEKPCWIVAINKTLGTSEDKIKELAKSNGWNGQTESLAVQGVIGVVADLLGQIPDLSLTKPARDSGLSAKEFSGSDLAGGKSGLVFTRKHVMPMINGRLSNFNGHGEEPVAAVATYTAKT